MMLDLPVFDQLMVQIDVILLMLDRPAVQRQLLVFGLLVLAAELVAWQLIDLRRQVFAIQDQIDRNPKAYADYQPEGWRAQVSHNRTLRRWLRALEHTYSPIIAILLGHVSVLAFQQSEWQAGLLAQGLIFFWLLLVYRLSVTLLYAWQSETMAQFYNRRFLLPFFLLLLTFTIGRLVSGIVDLAAVPLFAITENQITLGALYVSIVVLYTFLLLSWIIEGVLNRFVLPRFEADQGLANTIKTVSSYVVISIGLLTTLGTLGLDLSTLAIVGAGLSVGIGFGMQDLVGNFVSGILLLFEQSIRPGDIIEIDGKTGVVDRMRIRSTTVRTFDNIELIVPNQKLLTSTVTTLTHTSRRVRLQITVGASYNDDPQEVRDALVAAINRHGLILKEPAPLVFFTGYGDSSLNFEVMVWVDDLSHRGSVRSDLHFMIWREFQKRGLEMPYPQRDLHLRSSVPWGELMGKESTNNGRAKEEGDGIEEEKEGGREEGIR
ncbi:MAG: mechanosensitive ion channel [Caldilineaceae bacterium]|nr:mechanosensitive ion channel [Caldilineaceae bacterium]